MKISIKIVCGVSGPKEARVCGCAYLLTAARGRRRQVRTMAVPLGVTTANLAGLNGVRLALLSIDPAATSEAVVALTTDSYYAIDMLNKVGGKYYADPKFNVAAVLEMRAVYDRFEYVSVVYRKGSTSDRLRVLARQAAELGVVSDTGTAVEEANEDDGD